MFSNIIPKQYFQKMHTCKINEITTVVGIVN